MARRILPQSGRGMVGNPVIGWNVSQGIPRLTLGKIGVRFMAEQFFGSWKVGVMRSFILTTFQGYIVTSKEMTKSNAKNSK
jgi:hypothetical protein